MGMVKPKIAARPEANSCNPMMDMVCQPNTLGRPKAAITAHSRPLGHMRRPFCATYTNNHVAPSVMVVARKNSGVICPSESFIMGQFTPHISVRANTAQAWRRVITRPPGL